MKTTHHLFSLSEIHTRLIEIQGEPRTEEEAQRLRAKAKRLYSGMPVFKLAQRKHTKLHKQLRRQEKINRLFREGKYNTPLFRVLMRVFEKHPARR